jgi:integrase
VKTLLRLRWTYQKERFAICVAKDRGILAKAIQQTLIADLKAGSFDVTLRKYKAIEVPPDSPVTQAIDPSNPILIQFDQYSQVWGTTPNKRTKLKYCRVMLAGWDNLQYGTTSKLLENELYSARTYNERRKVLDGFFKWLIKEGQLITNPMEFTVAMRQNRQKKASRKPFTPTEVQKLLHAFKHDTVCSNHAVAKHSRYYSFVYTMLATGMRNGEGTGLCVGDVQLEYDRIHVWRSFSRKQVDGSSHQANRVLKTTKTDNERFIPMHAELKAVLETQCKGRDRKAFVFTTSRGNPINDQMFEKRIFKQVQLTLEIPVRDLYACRHTFATRAIQLGTPIHEVAYLLGDSVQTVLKNYFHNDKATRLPNILQQQQVRQLPLGL